MRWPRVPTDRSGWIFVALPLAGLAGWLLLAALSHGAVTGMVWWLLAVLAWEWALALVVWRRPASDEWRYWMVWGVVFRLIGLFAIPVLENDHYRFLWDGRMFALTGNPYGSAPEEFFGEASVPAAFADILDRVNYPDVPTIYGPVFEFGFLLSYLIAPAVLWPWKLLLLVADISLLAILRRLGTGETGARAAIFAAWCPLSVFETGFNAHPDGLAVALLAGALLAGRAGKDIPLGLACGLAVGAKVFALIAVPFLLWRRSWRACAAFLAASAACYAPFWLQGSSADLSGLRTFAGYWEFNSSGYALIKLAFGEAWARRLATPLFGIVWLALWVWWTRNGDRRRLLPGLSLFGLFFLLSPAFNPWYALWMLPFVALRPGPTGIAVLIAVSLGYLTRQNLGEGVLDGFGHPVWVRPVEFGIIAAALIVESVIRTRVNHRTLLEK